MSVIGPRPGLWNQDILTAERDKYNANDVKPGLTGWAQINGRDELEIPEKAKLDGEYVSKMGLMMDIKCFLGSVGVFAHDDSVVEGGTGEMKKVGRHYTDGKSAEELIGHIGFGETVEVDTETKKRVLITGAGSYIGETFKAYAEEYYPALEIDAVDMLDPAWREKDFSEYDIIYHVAGIAHEEGRVLEEHYLNENEEPTECWGYFGISYEHREREDIITYLDEEGNPVKIQSGYAIIVRSLDELGQALDDSYYDENWNPVMCTGGYSVHSYLPYTKVIYNAEELSLYARRCRTYRKRKLAVKKLQSCMGESIEILEETLWNTIKVFSGYFFETAEGKRFCYSVSGDEILISKSKESITRVDVSLALEKILELNGGVESLQNMKVPGAGYLYPVFLRFGLIRRKGESDGHLSDMVNIQ